MRHQSGWKWSRVSKQKHLPREKKRERETSIHLELKLNMHHLPKTPRIPWLLLNCIYICCRLARRQLLFRSGFALSPGSRLLDPQWSAVMSEAGVRYSSCRSVRDADVKSLDEGRCGRPPSDNAIFSLTGRFPSQWRSVFEWSSEGEAEGSCWVMGAEGAGTIK